MLEFLRKGVKSWVAKVLLALLVLSFAVWGIGDIFSFSLNSPVANVGSRTVTADAFANALQRQQTNASRQAQRAVSLTEIRQTGLGDQVLARLIRDAAIAAELEELGIAASDRIVAETIRSLPAFQGPGGDFSTTAYLQMLAQQGFDAGTFETLQRDLIGQEVLLSSAVGTVSLPPGAAARIAAHEGEQRRVAILRLTPDMAPEPPRPDSTTLGAFLEENALAFTEPDRKYGRFLHLDTRAIGEAFEPTEEALRAGYEAALSTFSTPAQAVVDQLNFPSVEAAEAAKAALEGGQSFEELLDSRGVAMADVALGTVGVDDLPAAMSAAVFGADGPGIVGPVETLVGAALLRVRELTAASQVPFEEARDQVAQALADREALSRAPRIAGEIDDLRAAGQTLEEIAEALEAVELGTIDGWALDGTLEGRVPAEGVLGRARLREELSDALDGEERDLIELVNGSYVLIAIDRIEPSFLPTLDRIRDRVAEAWERRERLDALAERAERIRGGLERGTGATLVSIAAGMGRPVLSPDPLRRGDTVNGAPVALIAALFEEPEGGAAQVEIPGG
ncbi:MAG: SurA N-terminal domain-containing protein, partial [Pseudomonadota bacterium]